MQEDAKKSPVLPYARPPLRRKPIRARWIILGIAHPALGACATWAPLRYGPILPLEVLAISAQASAFYSLALLIIGIVRAEIRTWLGAMISVILSGVYLVPFYVMAAMSEIKC